MQGVLDPEMQPSWVGTMSTYVCYPVSFPFSEGTEWQSACFYQGGVAEAEASQRQHTLSLRTSPEYGRLGVGDLSTRSTNDPIWVFPIDRVVETAVAAGYRTMFNDTPRKQ